MLEHMDWIKIYLNPKAENSDCSDYDTILIAPNSCVLATLWHEELLIKVSS